MKEELKRLKQKIHPQKQATKEWFLSLLDVENQREYEREHLFNVMRTLRLLKILPHKQKIKNAKAEINRLKNEEEHNAENYCKVTALLQTIQEEERKMNNFRPIFSEPYFARMDLVDPKEGYNSYYIGKRGDVGLEIVDWRAPIARRYYQKSLLTFSINEYDYKTILRRAIKAKDGKVEDFKNEFLSVKDYLSVEEINGRDEEILFDPYLREIIRQRKDEPGIKDIIETIQEKQFEIITCPERENFVLQGVAGSGKTMIMLHRLSYLMYNNDEIKARDVLMLTPSQSFNAFIDELSSILELERVRTSTLHDYFLQVLENENIRLKDRIDYSAKESERYLAYLYSDGFTSDLKKKIDRVYDNLYGLFLSEECSEFIEKICENVNEQLMLYESVKNASLRIRRGVLGEIKEKKDGGLYYTKPFRVLMNRILDVQDFFVGTLASPKAKNQTYFYRQLLRFYKSGVYASKYTEKICADALETLDGISYDLSREIVDLKRYKQRIGGVEVYIHEDRILAKEGLQKEAERIKEKVRKIADLNVTFQEFYRYLKGEKTFSAVGSGEDFSDVVRYFYKETVKKYKQKYGLFTGKLYPSDGYAVCKICSLLGKELSPKHSFVFVDEGQDISCGEYELLRYINDRAAFNVFGDLGQNVTDYRGIKRWETCFENYHVFHLNRNYRNTNQIVDFVSKNLQIDMQPMGFEGEQVARIQEKDIHKFFKDAKGLKAIICSEEDYEKYAKKSYHYPSKKGCLSESKINFMTVYQSKGLEFASVVVVDSNLSQSEKYIAYTRALKNLAIL